MYSAAGKSHSSRCLMVSTAVMTLFRAKLSATTVAATMQPVLNVVFCAKASKGDKSGILWGIRVASNPIKQRLKRLFTKPDCIHLTVQPHLQEPAKNIAQDNHKTNLLSTRRTVKNKSE